MSLTTAIKQNASPLAAAQNTYKQDVASVTTYINGVLTSKLPTLDTPPPDWQSFIDTYEQANAEALGWVNDVMGRLLAVPKEVQSYNDTISRVLVDAQTRAQTLIANPSDQQALEILQTDLTVVLSQLNLVTTFILSAVQTVQKFTDVLPGMGSELQAIATKSSQDAQADQAQINQLNADISKLQDDIASLQSAIIALAVADGVALTLGVVATIVAWPFGALTWLVLGPAVAVASTYIALDAEQIKADKATIEGDQQQITGLTADVATLQLLTSNYLAMAAQTEQIEASLQAILAAWQQLESDAGTAVADINQASSDAGSDAFQDALNDVNGAISEWNDAYAQAGSLSIDVQVNPVALQLEMSSSEVQSALAGGQSIGIIEYFNQVGMAM